MSPAERDKNVVGGERSLPAKPTHAGELSYSAQIAQQFSAYKQTPAQERQQHSHLSNTGVSVGGTDAVDLASYDGASGRRPVRPSEMKDEG